MWHAQITSLTLRDIPSGEAGYQRQEAFTAIAQVEMLGTGVAFVHGVLRTDGQSLGVRQWRDLGRLLRDQFAVMEVQAERHGERVIYDLVRLGT